MRKKMPFHSTLFMVAMTLPVIASAASEANETPVAEQSTFNWTAMTGLGYDNNVFRAPRAAYTDLSLGVPAVVIPQRKSGVFVPYEIKVDATKNRDYDSRLIGSAALDGSFYLGNGLASANQYGLTGSGGYEYVLARNEKSADTLYIGALVGTHKREYVDHDTGLGKTAFNRYNFLRFGVEAAYKSRAGILDYGLSGEYLLNDYEAPVTGSELDNSYLKLGAEVDVPISPMSKLNVAFNHSIRDYSNLRSRDNTGLSSVANPLLVYTYNDISFTLHNRISPDWLLYLDYDHTNRTDGTVGYNDYAKNRYGARALYGQGRIKARLSLHHWTRDYPSAFAFDVAAGGRKTYSGNDLKIKAEYEQTKNSALWTELLYKSQNTTDLRYDYVSSQFMAGMSWAY
ncbi:MAG: hypothetical protein WAW75_10220 [Gallionella sp.]